MNYFRTQKQSERQPDTLAYCSGPQKLRRFPFTLFVDVERSIIEECSFPNETVYWHTSKDDRGCDNKWGGRKEYKRSKIKSSDEVSLEPKLQYPALLYPYKYVPHKTYCSRKMISAMCAGIFAGRLA